MRDWRLELVDWLIDWMDAFLRLSWASRAESTQQRRSALSALLLLSHHIHPSASPLPHVRTPHTT